MAELMKNSDKSASPATTVENTPPTDAFDGTAELAESAQKAREESGQKIPKQGEKGYNKYLLKRILKYFAPYKLAIALAIVSLLCVSGATGGTAAIIKPILDGMFDKNTPFSSLVFIALSFVGLSTLKGLGRVSQNYFMQSSGLKVIERLRDELYTKVIKLPLRYYEGAQAGNLMSRIINDVALMRNSLNAIVIIIRETITIFGLLGVAFYMNFKLALVSFFGLPIIFFPVVYYGRKLRKLSRRNQAITADASVLLHEILNGIRVIKAFATEKKEGERFDHENRRLYKVSLRATMAGEFSNMVMEIVGAVGIAIVVVVGGMQVISKEITPGDFGAFVASLIMLYEPFKKINTNNNQVQRALAGAERVFEIIDSKEDIEEEGGTVQAEVPLSSMAINFENVSFAYSTGEVALKNINLSIHQGERLAIVGPSGAGKTTFINLLPRFYDPTSGSIKLNGMDLREYTLASLRRNIAIVSQDNFLFNYSIRDNIAYAQPEMPEAKVIEAAKAAYAHDFIMSMPDGYNTVIGERGVKLSGGQKQRLTIARAIAKNAPLLILDEATSALDSESEKIVQQALENLMKGRTSIVIAHRLSTVLASDRILVMQSGNIEAQGTHDELLSSCNLYAKLYALQFGTQ